MKHRFEIEKRNHSSGNFLVSIVFFITILFVFLLGISKVEERTDTQAREILSQAVSRGIVHCYSLEGAYPESLQYLKEHYGLIYDEDRFFVDYQALGSNILPDVTIIDRRYLP